MEYKFSYTLSEFMAIAGQKREGEASARAGRAEFTGTITFEEALELVESGWQGAPNLGEIATDILATEGATETQYQYGVSGAFVDIGAFLSGEPECMIDFVETETKPTVKLFVSGAANCAQTKEQIAFRGAVAVALADTLKHAGYSVEIWQRFGLASTDRNGHTARLDIKICDAGEALDMDCLAFYFCHASMLRRFVFSFLESMPKTFREMFDPENGYGTPIQPPAAEEAGALELAYEKQLPSTLEEARALYHSTLEAFQTQAAA